MRRVGVLVLVFLIATACSGGAKQVASPPTPTQSVPEELRGSTAIRFESSDGVKLEGRDFGSGAVGVVLAHGSDDAAQGTWFSFAHVLVQHGYRVVTFNFRGFCPRNQYGCSAGGNDPPNTWHDVVAAVGYLRRHGTTKVFIVGGSLGARSVLWAAAQPGVDVAGVIPISAGMKAAPQFSPGYDLTTEMLRRITAPKLFMAGETEPGTAAADARSMYAASDPPKTLGILPSGQHAWALVTLAEPKVIAQGTKLILDFIAAYG